MLRQLTCHRLVFALEPVVAVARFILALMSAICFSYICKNSTKEGKKLIVVVPKPTFSCVRLLSAKALGEGRVCEDPRCTRRWKSEQ